MGYLTINPDGQVEFDPQREGHPSIVVENVTHFLLHARYATRPIMCSSALDWVEDYTDDPRVIELCRELRQ